MDNSNGALSFEATLQYQDLKRSVDEIERRIKGMTSTVVSETDKIDSQFKRLGQLAAGYFTLNALADFAKQIVTVRGEFQQLEIAFTTMLRSKVKADALMAQAVDFAAKTPFNLKDVASGAKQLLAYGSSAKSVIDELRVLGDVAAGTSTPIGDLVYLYGTLRSQGRAYAVDIRQFAGRGIPIYAELAKVLKINTDQVNDFVTAGKVGFKEVEQAFKNMTSGNGLFAGTLDAQSKSVTGLISNLKDAYDVMLNNIGSANQGIIVEIISGASTVVKNYEPIIDVLTVLVATYGAYKAAVIAASVAQSAAVAAGNINAWLQLAAGVRSAKDAQIAFNLATSVNPYVAAITVITALAAAYVVYSADLNGAAKAAQTLTDAREKANEGVGAEMAKIEVLRTAINNEKLSRDDRNKALKELIALSPQHLNALTLDSVKTIDGTRSIEAYISAKKRQIELQTIEKDLADSIIRQNEARAGKNDISLLDKLASGAAAGEGAFNGDASAANAAKRKTLNDKLIADEEAYQAKLKERVATLNEIGSAGAKGEATVQAAQKKTADYYDAQIKSLKEEQAAQSTNQKQFDAYQKQIDAADKARRRITGELSKEEKKQAKDDAKSGPFGSIDYYEAISKKASELLEKLGPKDVAKIAEQSKIRFDADQKVEELRKKYAIKSFDEELADKRSKYELYLKWVEAYGKESADQQFGDLKKSGDSFLDYLNTQIARIESKRSAAKPLSDTDARNLGELVTQRDAVTGKKSAIQVFSEELQKAQVEAKSLTEYLAALKAKQDELNATPAKTPDDFAKRKQVAEEILQTQQQLKQQLDQYLVDFAGSEQQLTAIRAKYNELRASLDQKYTNNRNSEYKAALAILNSDEEKALEEFQKRQLEQSDAYKATTKTILEDGEKRAQVEIDRQRALVAEAKRIGGVTSELYRAELRKLNDLIEKSGGTPGQKMLATYGAVFSAFGQSLSSLGGDAAKAGEILTSLAGNLNLVGQAMDKSTTKNQQYAIAIQGLVQIFGNIATAAASRKKAESDYYTSLIAQQQQYNLLLNEQLGIQAKSKENVFVKDYVGELQDGFRQFDDAQAKYQESLKKLAEGKAKAGLKNSFDSASFLSSVGAGAAAGAAIGTIVPVVGNVVGAVAGAIVGGIAGLFSSNKKVNEFGNLLQLYPNLVKKTANGVDELNTALAESLIAQGLVDDQTKVLLQSTIEWQKQIEAAREAIKSIISDLAGNLGNSLRDNLVGAFKDGTDAAQVFSDSVANILEDLVTKMLFSQAFNKEFQKLQDDLTASLDTSTGGDGNTIDDFQRFTENSKDALDQYNLWLQQFQDAAAASGFDVLKPTKTGTKNPNSMSGVIQSQITEATANVLTGQINAIRITQADSNALIRQQLLSLSGIEQNTARIQRTNELLDSVDRRLKTISENSGRGLGQPG